MKTNKFITHFFILTLLLLCRYSYAEPNGTCWTDKHYLATFSASSFNGNKAGSTATSKFGNEVGYSMDCAPNPENLGLYYFKGVFGPGSNTTGDTLHLTDDVDVTVTIDASQHYQNEQVPFVDLYDTSGGKPPTAGGVMSGNLGQEATVVFTLTKDAIGGALVIPPGVILYEYYRSVYSGVYSVGTTFDAKTAGEIIPIETTCTINGGNTITVPFGDIDVDQLKNDGPSSVIKKDIQLNYSCTSSLTQDIDITLVGSTASFESTALQSSINDVGVVMMYDGKPVGPYQSFTSKLVDGTGSDTVTFSPIIRSGATNVQGNFTASATLIMTSA